MRAGVSRSSSLCLLALALCILLPTKAIYEDQVGSFNWRKSFIGEIGQAELLDDESYFVIPKDKSGFGLLDMEGNVVYFKELPHDKSALVVRSGSRKNSFDFSHAFFLLE